ncbi:class F sortase [Micromonospora sp. NPDC050397]|uniref:class F sortase n=1 Tax=Micromonospora sp. NPDC050397 TaxID=3364279 RepID=UPI00384E43B2
MAGRLAPVRAAHGRAWRVFSRLVTEASAASIVTPDTADRTAPGTLRPGTAGATGPAVGPGPGTRGRAVGTARPPGAAPVAAGTPGHRPTRDRITRVRGQVRRRPGPVPVIIVLIGLIVTGFGVQYVTGRNFLPGFSSGTQPPPRKFPVMAQSPPTAITIPSLDVRARVHRVGIAPDGSIAVPPPDRYQEAGWYDQSPTPGQYGPSVIVGHVDTRTGPAVFHDLAKVRAGAQIEITRMDRSVAVFKVNSVRRFDKSQLPTDQVFEDFNRPGLRLITCGGRWVGGTTGYADNVVVFASLVSARPP